MDFLGIIAIIFVGIILSAVSSAARKKQHDDDSEGKPPRRPMSELQRAFMMMSGMESEEDERKGETIISGFNAPRPPTGTANAQGFTGEGHGNYEGMGKSESSGDFEGLSDYSSAPHGSITGNSLIEEEISVNRYSAGSPRTARETNSDSTAYVFELSGSSLEDRAEMEHRLDESAEMADLAESSIIFAEADRPRPRLKLFEDKNDLVKAVIFSEVLARRSPFGRAAKR